MDTFRPMQPFLVKVKVDRGEQYKIAYRWPLAELKLVDGKTLNQVGLIFLLWQRAELIIGERYECESRETQAGIHKGIRVLWSSDHMFRWWEEQCVCVISNIGMNQPE